MRFRKLYGRRLRIYVLFVRYTLFAIDSHDRQTSLSSSSVITYHGTVCDHHSAYLTIYNFSRNPLVGTYLLPYNATQCHSITKPLISVSVGWSLLLDGKP